jgi:hypothetical protein
MAGVGSNYILSLSGTSPPITGNSYSSMSLFVVDTINAGKGPPGKTIVATAALTSDGNQSGLLQSANNIMVDGPHYSLFWGIQGKVSVTDGSSGSFSDPVFLTLPPGWTYSLNAIDPSSLVPEPSSWLETGIGMVGLALVVLRRHGSRATQLVPKLMRPNMHLA